MGNIKEISNHEEMSVCIIVSEKEDDEIMEPWRFCQLNVDSAEKFTPKELKLLGRWLVQEGTRLGRQYTSKGESRSGIFGVLV